MLDPIAEALEADPSVVEVVWDDAFVGPAVVPLVEGGGEVPATGGERRAAGRASQDEERGETWRRGETRESEVRRGRARQDEGEREDGRCQGMSKTDEIG